MAHMANLIADALAAEVRSRTEWDEAPALYFLYLEGGKPHLRQLPLPDALWAQGRPPQVLLAMADSLGEWAPLLRAAAPEGLHGAAFRCESWMVQADRPGTARYAEVAAQSKVKRLHLRPDAVETRNMYAVDRAGITYGAAQARGEDEVKKSVSYPKAGHGFAGVIPEALDRLVMTLLGVGLPARERLED